MHIIVIIVVIIITIIINSCILKLTPNSPPHSSNRVRFCSEQSEEAYSKTASPHLSDCQTKPSSPTPTFPKHSEKDTLQHIIDLGYFRQGGRGMNNKSRDPAERTPCQLFSLLCIRRAPAKAH